MVWKSRWKETPRSSPSFPTSSHHSFLRFGEEEGVTLPRYAVRKARLGITLRPAHRASPASHTSLMTWRCLAFPNSLSARRERMASSAGLFLEPGTQLSHEI